MNILFVGQGYGEPMAYVLIWGCLFLAHLARQSLNASLFKASAITAAIYITPCLSAVGVFLWLGIGIARYETMQDDRLKYSRGKLTFTHKYFGDAQSKALHNGFSYEEGASTWSVASDDSRIPAEMKQVAHRAIRIDPLDPYRTHVIVETTVELERGKPVIYDHIVTRDQLERHASGGLWNLPKGAVKYNGKELPQMDSLSAAFVDQFNGPDLTKVRRR